MFQRALLRQSQAVKSAFSSTRTSTPLAARQTSPLQPQLLRPLAYQPAYRFYSTEKNGENGKDSEAATKQETPEDPVRKELEEKKKEASELKVFTYEAK